MQISSLTLWKVWLCCSAAVQALQTGCFYIQPSEHRATKCSREWNNILLREHSWDMRVRQRHSSTRLLIIFCSFTNCNMFQLMRGYFSCSFQFFIDWTIHLTDLLLHCEHYSCTCINLVCLCFTAGQWWSPCSPLGHPASLYQLARLRGAVLAHRHAEIPQKGQGCQSILCWTHCCALQVKCIL